MRWDRSSHLPPVCSAQAPASDFSILLPWNLLQGQHNSASPTPQTVWQAWGTAITVHGALELTGLSHGQGCLSAHLPRIFPIRFSGTFLWADFNISEKRVFTAPLGDFSLASASAVIILDDFVRAPPCPKCSISEYFICQTVKIKEAQTIYMCIQGP